MTLFDALHSWKRLLWGIAVAAGVFDLYYLSLAHLPGNVNDACEVGVLLTRNNIVFGVIFALMCGVLTAGYIALHENRAAMKKGVISATGIGVVLASLSAFCTACTLPIISLIGVSAALTFLSNNTLLLQVISILLLGGALILLNRQLTDECEHCKI